MKLAYRGRRAPLSEGPLRASRTAVAALSTLALTALSSCYTDSEGLDPPHDQLYFPTNLVVSPGGKALYVTNSDFDLQYNGGTVQLLDLESLRSAALLLQDQFHQGTGTKEACEAIQLSLNAQTLLNPGPCSPLELQPFVKQSATIGAFASSAVLVHDPAGSQARLFVSVRGDPSVTYFDVGDDRDPQAGVAAPAKCSEQNPAFCMVCGQSADQKRCTAEHRIGEDPTDSIRQLAIQVEPLGLAATEDGSALVTVHQTEQTASLIANYWNAPSAADGRDAKPFLEYFLSGLPFRPTEVVTLPVPRFLRVWDVAPAANLPYAKPIYQPAFMVTHQAANEITFLRYHSDEGASPRRPFLTRGGVVRVTANSAGDDSRGAAVDASARKACEAGCAEADLECLLHCATTVPLRFFVANRAPASLLIGEIKTVLAKEGEGASTKVTGAFEDAAITSVVPLTLGASRVAVGHVIDENGERRVRVFAAAFDLRLIFVYDPEASRIESVIHTGRGPHALAFDTGGEGEGAYSFLYVGHFTDSYIGVVDLDMRRLQTFGSMFLTVGKPVPPRESK
jgi:hypothetical protein